MSHLSSYITKKRFFDVYVTPNTGIPEHKFLDLCTFILDFDRNKDWNVFRDSTPEPVNHPDSFEAYFYNGDFQENIAKVVNIIEHYYHRARKLVMILNRN